MDVVFKSVLGDVSQSEIINSLMIMLKGMVGIFFVMILIYLIIVLLNKLPGQSKNNNKS